MSEAENKKKLLGPAYVAGANAMRALDAPIRYPLLLKTYDWGGTLQSALRLSGLSSFIVLVEHLVGMLLLAPILLFKRGGKHFVDLFKGFSRKEKFSLLGISIGSGLGLYFYLIAFAMGNPTVAIVVQKSQPIITMIIAVLFLKEKPSKIFYLAGAISMIGVFFLAFEDLQNPQMFELIAVGASLIAAIFWGSNTVWGRTLAKRADYWDITLFRYIGGTLILVIFNLLTFAFTAKNFEILSMKFTTFAPMFPGAIAPLAYPIEMSGMTAIIVVAIMTGGIIPLAIYYYGLKHSSASIGGLAELAFPVLAIFVNYAFLGFALSTTQLIGAGIILISTTWLMFINRREFASDAEN